MGTPGRIQEVVSSLKERQQPVYRKDVSRSAIPKLNSPVVLVSTDLTCSHTLCERTYGFFIRKPKKKRIHSDKAKLQVGNNEPPISLERKDATMEEFDQYVIYNEMKKVNICQ
jgi:hypothetical protein